MLLLQMKKTFSLKVMPQPTLRIKKSDPQTINMSAFCSFKSFNA